MLWARNFSWKYYAVRETSRVAGRSRLYPERRNRFPLLPFCDDDDDDDDDCYDREGSRARELYSKRVEKRFIQTKKGAAVPFLEPLQTSPRVGVKLARSHDCPKSRNRVYRMRFAPREDYLPLLARIVFLLFVYTHRTCRDVRRRGTRCHQLRLFPHGASAPHRAQMPVILHPPVPFMDIATSLLLHRTSMLIRICVNYYIRGRRI